MMEPIRNPSGNDTPLCGRCLVSNLQDVLVFRPDAGRKLREFIGWGRFDYPANCVEQGGWLIGRYVRDGLGRGVRAEVTAILPAESCVGTPTYLEWTALEDIRLQRAFFRMKDDLSAVDPQAGEALSVLGWFHTHPNQLPVFMSGTDMETQRLKFFRPEHFAVVLNPHRRIWKAFKGKEAAEVPAVMLWEDGPVPARSPVRPSRAGKDPRRKKRRGIPRHSKKASSKRR